MKTLIFKMKKRTKYIVVGLLCILVLGGKMILTQTEVVDRKEKITDRTDDLGCVIKNISWTTKTENGLKITESQTIYGNRMIKGYYTDDLTVAFQEKYVDGKLVSVFDLNKAEFIYERDPDLHPIKKFK